MPINDPNRPRSSGEWSPFVTLEAFASFLVEFREGRQHVDKKLDEITQRIAKGDTKFELLQRDAAECKIKQDTHSTLIKALTTKDTVRDATAAAQPTQLGVIAQAAISAAVTVIVGGILGFAYKLFVLDIKQEVKQEEKASHSTHVSPP